MSYEDDFLRVKEYSEPKFIYFFNQDLAREYVEKLKVLFLDIAPVVLELLKRPLRDRDEKEFLFRVTDFAIKEFREKRMSPFEKNVIDVPNDLNLRIKVSLKFLEKFFRLPNKSSVIRFSTLDSEKLKALYKNGRLLHIADKDVEILTPGINLLCFLESLTVSLENEVSLVKYTLIENSLDKNKKIEVKIGENIYSINEETLSSSVKSFALSEVENKAVDNTFYFSKGYIVNRFRYKDMGVHTQIINNSRGYEIYNSVFSWKKFIDSGSENNYYSISNSKYNYISLYSEYIKLKKKSKNPCKILIFSEMKKDKSYREIYVYDLGNETSVYRDVTIHTDRTHTYEFRIRLEKPDFGNLHRIDESSLPMYRGLPEAYTSEIFDENDMSFSFYITKDELDKLINDFLNEGQ